MRQGMSRRGGDTGIALLTVLWFLVAMSGLAVAIASIGRDSAFTVRNAVAAIEARAAFASATEIAAAALSRGSFASSGELEWQQGRLKVRIVATAENSKIDINAASDALIEGLAAAAASASDRPEADGVALGHAILDWRDTDRNRRLAGAEENDYDASSKPRDGPFPFIAELRSVKGMDEELFALIAPAVTVHHGAEEPSVGPALPLVSEALDRSRGLVAGDSAEQASAFDSPRPLDDTDTEDLAALFVNDPSGLYTLSIEVSHDDGPTHRHETVIWIEPPLGDRRHAILESRSGVLSDETLQSMTAGNESWPER
jgi:general secretion pathway protein K